MTTSGVWMTISSCLYLQRFLLLPSPLILEFVSSDIRRATQQKKKANGHNVSIPSILSPPCNLIFMLILCREAERSDKEFSLCDEGRKSMPEKLFGKTTWRGGEGILDDSILNSKLSCDGIVTRHFESNLMLNGIPPFTWRPEKHRKHEIYAALRRRVCWCVGPNSTKKKESLALLFYLINQRSRGFFLSP